MNIKKLIIGCIILSACSLKAIDYYIVNGVQFWVFSKQELITACGQSATTNQCGVETSVFIPMLVDYLKQQGTNLPPEAVGYLCDSRAYVQLTNLNVVTMTPKNKGQ